MTGFLLCLTMTTDCFRWHALITELQTDSFVISHILIHSKFSPFHMCYVSEVLKFKNASMDISS